MEANDEICVGRLRAFSQWIPRVVVVVVMMMMMMMMMMISALQHNLPYILIPDYILVLVSHQFMHCALDTEHDRCYQLRSYKMVRHMIQRFS